MAGSESCEIVSGILVPGHWSSSFYSERVGLADFSHDDPWLHLDGDVLSLDIDDGDPARCESAETLLAIEVPHGPRHNLILRLFDSRSSL